MLEPKARIKSGLIAVALGLSATFSPVGNPFSLWSSSTQGTVMAQSGIPAPAYFGSPSGTSAAPTPMVPAHAIPASSQPNQPSQRQAASMTLQEAHAVSAGKLLQARKAVAAKDFGTASRIALEVQAMGLTYQDTQERPENIGHLIQQSQQLARQQSVGVTDQYRRDYARFMLQQAAGLLPYGEIDLAMQLTREAQAQGVEYNHADIQAGLEPQSMLRRIDDIRRIRNAATTTPMSRQTNNQEQSQSLSMAAQRDLSQAISMMQQARQALSTGQIDRAELLCNNARNLRISESLFPANVDVPSQLLAEIAAKRQSMPAPVAQPTWPSHQQHQPANAAQQPTQQAVYHPNMDATQNIPVAGQYDRNGMVPMNQAPLVDQVRRDRDVLTQQVASSIMQQISDANRLAREQRNPEAGLDLLNSARRQVEQSQLDPATKASFLRNIDKAIAETSQFVERYDVQFSLDQQNQEVLDSLRLSQEERISRQQRLKTYVDECNKCLEAKNYEEAIRYAKMAREIAPDEPAAQMLYTTTQLAWNVQRSIASRDGKAEGFVNAMHEVDEAAIATPLGERGIAYGAGWGEMTSRRRSMQQITESRRPASEREIIRRLEMPVSLNFGQALPLEQIFKLLQGQTDVDFFVDWPALAEVDVTASTPVSITIAKEIKFRSALNLILKQYNLAYVIQNEMLNITSVTKARGQLYSEMYYVGDLIMGIPNANGQGGPSDFNAAMDRAMMQSVSPTLGQRSSLYNAGQMGFDNNLAGQSMNPNVLGQMASSGLSSSYGSGNNMGTSGGSGAAGGNQADFGEIMELIEAVVSPETWTANGGEGEMTPYYPNLSLVVRQTEEVHAELVELLNQLRKLNDLQIAVEVRYITLSDDFYEKMGLDFNLNFKNNGATDRITWGLTTSSSGDSNNNNSNNSNNSNNNNNNNSSTGSLYPLVGGNTTVGLTAAGMQSFSTDLGIPFTQNSYTLATPVYGGYDQSAGLNVGFALLSDIEAYFFMTASQGDTRSNLLTAPKVTVFNGQMALVRDVTMQPYVTSVIPVVGDFAAAYQPIICILNEGMTMGVQGTVSSNRQYVRLTLNPVFSKVTKVDTFRYVGEDTATETTETSSKGDESNATTGDEKASKTTANRSASGVTIQLPRMATFDVQTTVSVPDGGTILLGGIKRLKEGRIEAGTPILNKIPYINRLFMNTAIGRETQSIMMMVTPRIIIQEEEEEYITGVTSAAP